eukprot:4186673-Lingulodinium_polyedra.AAC.1
MSPDDFFNDCVRHRVDQYMQPKLEGFLMEWAQARYTQDSLKRGMPDMKDLRQALHKISTSYGGWRLHLLA